MTQAVTPLQKPNPVGQSAREASTLSPDPLEAESLLRSAEKIEATERRMQEVQASMAESSKQARAAMEAMRTRDHLPKWVVALLLLSFFAFLVFVTLKHYA